MEKKKLSHFHFSLTASATVNISGNVFGDEASLREQIAEQLISERYEQLDVVIFEPPVLDADYRLSDIELDPDDAPEVQLERYVENTEFDAKVELAGLFPGRNFSDEEVRRFAAWGARNWTTFKFD